MSPNFPLPVQTGIHCVSDFLRPEQNFCFIIFLFNILK